MSAIKKVLGNWWFLTVACALAFTLAAVFFFGPAFPSLLPFRLYAIGLVWFVFAGAAVWRILTQRKAEKQLEEAVIAPTSVDRPELQAKMTKALKTLHEKERGALYKAPWYVIVGPPGAGKTTLIKKSGMRLHTDDAAAGIGGTRNCDWWFCDEAIFLDTAGRYLSQDSDQQRDALDWSAFLQLVGKSRPLQPLNGVIVAIGLDEIAQAQAEKIDDHIISIRKRIDELSRALDFDLPVYVVFTKADLIRGFVEFFNDLSVEGRYSVLGHTLAADAGAPSIDSLCEGYDAFVQAMADRAPTRLREEVSPSRRAAAISVPAQLLDLRTRIVRLLEGVFIEGGAAPQDAPKAKLRGFYFTSGVQEGTPFDRILGSMAARARHTTANATPGEGTSRAFFIRRLLKEVVIPEAGWAAPSLRRRRRDRLVTWSIAAACGLFAIIGAIAWTSSFLYNRNQQNLAAARVEALQAAQSPIDEGDLVTEGSSLREVLDYLDLLGSGGDFSPGTAPSQRRLASFGLYRSDLRRESARAYADALHRFLLPRLILTAERAVQEARGDTMKVYNPLKAYLMLGGQAGEKRDDRYLANWLDDHLTQFALPGLEYETDRTRIMSHVEAMLNDKGAYARGLSPPLLDRDVIAQAQADLAIMTPAQRALSLIAVKSQTAPWRLVGDGILQGEADAFANPETLRAVEVPGLYTKAGFIQDFVAGIPTASTDLARDAWMFGADDATDTEFDSRELAELYAAAYIEQWTRVLNAPAPLNYRRNPTALARIANKATSPLRKIIDAVEANATELVPGEALEDAVERKLQRGAVGRMATNALNERAENVPSAIASRRIEANFADLIRYGYGPGAQIEDALEALNAYQRALASADVNGADETTGRSLANAASELSVAANTVDSIWPSLSGFFKSVAGRSKRAARSVKTDQIKEAFSGGVFAACDGAISGRYPFGGVTDANPSQVRNAVQAIAAEGASTYADLIERGVESRWKQTPATSGFDPESAKLFDYADALMALMSGDLAFRFSAPSDNRRAIRFRLGSDELRLKPGGDPERVVWLPERAQVAAVDGRDSSGKVERQQEGPWSLFKLLEKADKTQVGSGRYRFQFGPRMDLDIEIAGGPDPFKPGGPFALRCIDQL